MTIEQYMTITGMQFWRSLGVSLLVTVIEYVSLLFFVRRYEVDSFFDRHRIPLHLGSLLLFFFLQLWHLPVLWHCLLLVLLAGSYIALLTHCPWKNGCFEGCIFCLYLELGKSLCRDGLLAYAFTKVFSGMVNLSLNLTMLSLYLAYLVLMSFLFSRRRTAIFLPITGREMAALLFPFVLYLAVRHFQYQKVRSLSELSWLWFDLLQYAIAICAVLVMDTTQSMLGGQIEKNELLQGQMLKEKQEQLYLSQRESMEYIDRRYHDLKHYLTAMEAALGEAGIEEKRDLSEVRDLVATIRREIDPYAQFQRTGSTVLDVLLQQRMQECQHKGIELVPYIDGRSTGFLGSLDLCALFGNAMDNVIEAVEGVKEEALRKISVKVGLSDGFLLMRFENYFEGERKRVGTTFLTTKEAPLGHGLGLRNIEGIAEKYGGTISTEVTENRFTLHVLIPLPEEEI